MAGSFTSLSRRPHGALPFAAPAASTIEALENVGRRAAARLRLSIPAKLTTITETRNCIMLDLSRSGAQIGLEKPMDAGEAGFLRFAGFEVFGCVVRKGTGLNGLEFDVPLSDDDVLVVRQFAEAFEKGARDALRDEARAWVMGRG